MLDLEISEKQLKDMERFFATTPETIDKVLKAALRKAGNRVKKIQRDYANNRYVNSENSLNSKTHKVKTNAEESIISANSKKGNMEKFYVSLYRPSASVNKLKAQVSKSTGKKTMDTMFWAFYKNNKSKQGLFIRNGKDRNKISKVTTVSPFIMASKTDQLLMEDEVQMIFANALEEAIYKELG